MEGDCPLPLDSATDSDSSCMESSPREGYSTPPLEFTTDSGSEQQEADAVFLSESASDANSESEGIQSLF